MERQAGAVKWTGICEMLLAVGVAAAACSASAGLPAALTLRPGDTEIVVAADAPKTVRFAAEEMQALLSQAFGESVPLVGSPTKGKRGIFLGDSAAARAAGIDVARLPRDGYRIKTAKNAVFIAGRDDPGVDAFARAKSDGVSNLYYERGTLFGVYEFLERFAGMRFYFPGELGTIVPKAAKIDVPATDISDAPDFTVRMVSYFWDGKQTVPEDASLRGNSFKTINCYRMRFQTESIVCSHGQNGFRIPERFAATNPEYFQLRKDGTRCLAVDSDKGCVYCRQLCQSSAIWDEIWKDVQSYLKGESASVRKIPHWRKSSRERGEFEWNHNFQRTHGGLYIDVMPQDGMKDCYCEKCQAAYRKASNPRYPHSELVWGRTAELARRLKSIGSDAQLVQMAYGSYRGLPDLELPDNIIVMVAVRGQWSMVDPKQLELENATIRGWDEKTGRKVWLWNYPCKVQCGMMMPDVPQMAPHEWGDYYKLVGPMIIGAYAESNSDRWIYNYLNYYVYGKVAWNNKVDVGAIIEEHHRLMFGKAAPHMKAFYELLEEKWTKEVAGNAVETPLGPSSMEPSRNDLWFKIYSPEVVARLEGHLAAAAACVPAGSLEGRRVALMRRELFEPLAAAASAYVERHDLRRALKRNAANPSANILDEKRFSNVAKFVCSDCPLTGQTSFRLVSTNNANLYYTFPKGTEKMKPNTRYRLSYFMRCEDLKPVSRGGGATVSIFDAVNGTHYVPDIYYPKGTTDWMYFDYEFTTGDKVDDPAAKKHAYLTLRIRNAVGTAYFDDVRLEEVR